MTPLKRCSRPSCHKLLPATPEYFSRNKASKDGLQNYCKPCQQAAQNVSRGKAPKLLKDKVEPTPSMIPCLNCKEDFASTHKFNRICPACKKLTGGSEEDWHGQEVKGQ